MQNCIVTATVGPNGATSVVAIVGHTVRAMVGPTIGANGVDDGDRHRRPHGDELPR